MFRSTCSITDIEHSFVISSVNYIINISIYLCVCVCSRSTCSNINSEPTLFISIPNYIYIYIYMFIISSQRPKRSGCGLFFYRVYEE